MERLKATRDSCYNAMVERLRTAKGIYYDKAMQKIKAVKSASQKSTMEKIKTTREVYNKITEVASVKEIILLFQACSCLTMLIVYSSSFVKCSNTALHDIIQPDQSWRTQIKNIRLSKEINEGLCSYNHNDTFVNRLISLCIGLGVIAYFFVQRRIRQLSSKKEMRSTTRLMNFVLFSYGMLGSSKFFIFPQLHSLMYGYTTTWQLLLSPFKLVASFILTFFGLPMTFFFRHSEDHIFEMPTRLFINMITSMNEDVERDMFNSISEDTVTLNCGRGCWSCFQWTNVIFMLLHIIACGLLINDDEFVRDAKYNVRSNAANGNVNLLREQIEGGNCNNNDLDSGENTLGTNQKCYQSYIDTSTIITTKHVEFQCKTCSSQQKFMDKSPLPLSDGVGNDIRNKFPTKPVNITKPLNITSGLIQKQRMKFDQFAAKLTTGNSSQEATPSLEKESRLSSKSIQVNTLDPKKYKAVGTSTFAISLTQASTQTKFTPAVSQTSTQTVVYPTAGTQTKVTSPSTRAATQTTTSVSQTSTQTGSLPQASTQTKPASSSIQSSTQTKFGPPVSQTSTQTVCLPQVSTQTKVTSTLIQSSTQTSSPQTGTQTNVVFPVTQAGTQTACSPQMCTQTDDTSSLIHATTQTAYLLIPTGTQTILPSSLSQTSSTQTAFKIPICQTGTQTASSPQASTQTKVLAELMPVSTQTASLLSTASTQTTRGVSLSQISTQTIHKCPSSERSTQTMVAPPLTQAVIDSLLSQASTQTVSEISLLAYSGTAEHSVIQSSTQTDTKSPLIQAGAQTEVGFVIPDVETHTAISTPLTQASTQTDISSNLTQASTQTEAETHISEATTHAEVERLLMHISTQTAFPSPLAQASTQTVVGYLLTQASTQTETETPITSESTQTMNEFVLTPASTQTEITSPLPEIRRETADASTLTVPITPTVSVDDLAIDLNLSTETKEKRLLEDKCVQTCKTDSPSDCNNANSTSDNIFIDSKDAATQVCDFRTFKSIGVIASVPLMEKSIQTKSISPVGTVNQGVQHTSKCWCNKDVNRMSKRTQTTKSVCEKSIQVFSIETENRESRFKRGASRSDDDILLGSRDSLVYLGSQDRLNHSSLSRSDSSLSRTYVSIGTITSNVMDEKSTQTIEIKEVKVEASNLEVFNEQRTYFFDKRELEELEYRENETIHKEVDTRSYISLANKSTQIDFLKVRDSLNSIQSCNCQKDNIGNTIHSLITDEEVLSMSEPIKFKAKKSYHGIWYVCLRGDIFLSVCQEVLMNIKLLCEIEDIQRYVEDDILRTMKAFVDNYKKLSVYFDDDGEESDDESFINGFRL